MNRTLLALALALPALLAGRPADACGGFFCSTIPVDQTGENILFAVDDKGVEVHVQIAYQGAETDFAWIVPTRAAPTLAVGGDQVFTALAAATRPTFAGRWHYPQCGGWGWGGEQASAGGAADLGAFSPDGGSPVNVISEEQIGPYDSVVLKSDDPKALATWLKDNGYRLTTEMEIMIEPYVLEHDFFVALKLHSGKTVVDLQPIILRFAGDEPCVPLRLTAVAALNDMQVTAWVLGSSRAVPLNYYEVRPNLARINWLTGGSNYQQIVSEAADEAGGNAFVTEFAGKSSVMKGALWTEGRYDLAQLRATTDPVAYMQQIINQGLPRTTQMLNLLRRFIPMPQSLAAGGVTEQQFYNNMELYRPSLAGFQFDPIGFTNEIDLLIVQPLMQAQSLFDRLPYLTRLFTRISPTEMTRDPTFAYNPDLPDVDNVQTADIYPSCDWNGPVSIVLPDKRTIVLSSQSSRGTLDAMPAAQAWYQMGPSGPGQLIGSNATEIDQGIARHAPSTSGCRAAPADGPTPITVAFLFLVGGTGLLAFARRRPGARS
jgi:hypothetical protein